MSTWLARATDKDLVSSTYLTPAKKEENSLLVAVSYELRNMNSSKCVKVR